MLWMWSPNGATARENTIITGKPLETAVQDVRISGREQMSGFWQTPVHSSLAAAISSERIEPGTSGGSLVTAHVAELKQQVSVETSRHRRTTRHATTEPRIDGRAVRTRFNGAFRRVLAGSAVVAILAAATMLPAAHDAVAA
jgi:hypothetical protein